MWLTGWLVVINNWLSKKSKQCHLTSLSYTEVHKIDVFVSSRMQVDGVHSVRANHSQHLVTWKEVLYNSTSYALPS